MTANDASISFGRLDRRVAVVVGASGLVDRALCRTLVGAGAEVMLVGRDADRLDALQQGLDLGDHLAVTAADVTSQLEVDDARAATLARFGRVDLLVVSNAVITGSAFEDGVPADWAEMIDVNLRGLLHAAQAFAEPLLETAGRGEPADMIFIGAVGAGVLVPRFAVFNAVSAAIKQLSRTLGQEYGPRGLRVRTVEPGFVPTEPARGGGPGPRDTQDGRLAGISEPLQPEVIAALVAMTAALPGNVNLAEMIVLPVSRATAR